jgi:hypothetical protein
MTAAQKAAKANFKKAIEYRKKTGVSLKEAFAHVYGKKVGAAPKKKVAKKAAPKKAAKKVAKKAAPKKVAKKAAPKKHTKYGKVKAHTRRVAGVKKAESIHKDTKSHNVNIRVVSGIGKVAKLTLEELNKAISKYYQYKEIIDNINKDLKEKPNMPSYQKKDLRDTKKTFTSLMKEQKIHIAQLKKHIK